MLKSMKDILIKAKKEGYGVAAPNVYNLETVRACFEAARELKSPIIIDGGQRMGIEEIAFITLHFAQQFPDVTAALNLDHGQSFEVVMRAIRTGYTSIMRDASMLPFEENIKEVQEVVKMCKPLGISVEAELGHVGMGVDYKDTRDSGLTKPEEAAEYIKRTGIDMLAVAIGTSHGTYTGEPYLDFPLLKKILEVVDIPLVLHGGSGTGDENLQKAVQIGIQKVNLFTDLSDAGLAKMNQEFKTENESSEISFETGTVVKSKANMQKMTDIGAEGYKEKLMHYMKLFGSVGKDN